MTPGGRVDLAPRPPSRSAMLTAAARSLCVQDAQPPVLDDQLSGALAGEQGKRMIEQAREALTPEELLSFCRWVCVRARVAEDEVADAFASGIRQYVILGAGLDSFAFRRGRAFDRLRVFEVDHPASQGWKRRRLQEMGVVEPPDLVFAPVDFETQTIADGLTAAGFDFEAPAVFSWMGVTMYLTEAAIESTLEAIASCAGSSRLVMTYNLPAHTLDEFSRRVTLAVQEIITRSGEAWLSLFNPTEIEKLVAEHGFVRIRHVGADDARRAYFDAREDIRIAGAQRVLIATVP